MYEKRIRNLVTLLNLVTFLGLIAVLLLLVAQFDRSTTEGSVVILPSTPTPTATPWVKQNVLVMMRPAGLEVWTDNAEVDRLVIDTVDGVVVTLTYGDGYMIYVRVDPRYDKVLVAEAIIDRLTKNVPGQGGQIE